MADIAEECVLFVGQLLELGVFLPQFLGLFRDLYVSLGEPLTDGHWAVRVQVKPFVRWLWLGALLVAAGGVLAITDARYRRTVLGRSAHSRGALAMEAG